MDPLLVYDLGWLLRRGSVPHMCPKVQANRPESSGRILRQEDIDAFARSVRSALSHIYDLSYLQAHPLAASIGSDASQDTTTRAQSLRRALLEAISELEPIAGPGDASEQARSYALLTSRYLDGLSVEAIASELGLSRRQAFRELRKGVLAIASQLQTQLRLVSVKDPDGLQRTVCQANPVQAEIDRLRAHSHREYLDVRHLVKNVLEIASPLVQQQNVDIQIADACGGRPLSTYAERVVLRQALLALVNHALTYAPRGLLLTFRQDDGRAQVSIRSTGSLRRTPRSHRSGQWLTPDAEVARDLLEGQGGSLAIKYGARQWCAVAELPPATGPCILVVDDNADLVSLFQRYLGGHNVSIVGVADDQQVIGTVSDLRPQLVILDLMMPEQDGWEILKGLNSDPEARHIPVIICSVLDHQDLALASGASDYLVKPVTQRSLLDTLERWLGALSPS